MYALGIDTSNYATSLAVVDYTVGEVVCELKRFLPVKEGERGLRQSDALFYHTRALPEMLCELFANCDASKISKIGVSTRPRSEDGSYMPCFAAGISAATAFSLAQRLQLTATSHQDGHIAAAVFATRDKSLYQGEKLVFHISGGTTELLLCDGIRVIKKLSQTTDLYAGQAVDRVGVRMGFAFPAGNELSAIADKCNELIVARVSIKDGNCSLSGLENQCNALLLNGRSNDYVAKYCLSQIGYTVIQMLKHARMQYSNIPVICAGGVMCSDIVRKVVQAEYPSANFVPSKFSSDNAIGVAIIAARESVSKCKQ